MRTRLSIQHESGAALVVGLMILLLATFLAVATMNNSGMQERMASNSQNINMAFQAAESAVDEEVNNIGGGNLSLLGQAVAQMNNSTPSWPTYNYTTDNTQISTSAEVRAKTQSICPESASITADEGTTGIPAYLFEIQSTSRISGSSTRVSIIQGLHRC